MTSVQCLKRMRRVSSRCSPTTSFLLCQRPLSTLPPGLPGVSLLPFVASARDSGEEAAKKSRHGCVAERLERGQVLIDVADFTGDYALNDVSEFGTSLVSTLLAFRKAEKTACFLQCPIDYAHFMNVAAVNGFKFHHASGEVATLGLSLLPSEPLPPFATHTIDVDVVCLRGSGTGATEVLVVPREGDPSSSSSGSSGDGGGNLRLPTVRCGTGEDFRAAAARAVKGLIGEEQQQQQQQQQEEEEEEGPQPQLLTMRHSHGGGQFGSSIIHLTMLLRADPPSSGGQACGGARWVSVDDAGEEHKAALDAALAAATSTAGSGELDSGALHYFATALS
jgi:hypothetical protein